TAAYIYRGPLQLRIWEQRDPESQELVAIKQYINTNEQERTIWMDGRPHPSANAPHTWMGFSTGEWNGSMLTVTTTHIKQGWTRRNGFPSSDRITLRETFSQGAASSQAGPPRAAAAPARGAGDLEIMRVQNNVYAIFGAGGNITLQVGDAGPLLVDSGLAGASEKIIAAVKTVSDKP